VYLAVENGGGLVARACPECLHPVPVGHVLAYSNDIIYGNCGKPLEVSMLSRYIAAFVGLIAAVIVWWAASKRYAHDSWALAWVLPIVFSYFAFSIVAPIVLALIGDLEPRTIETVAIHTEPSASTHHPSH